MQCEQLTHTLNMTLRNTQYIGAKAPKTFFSGDLEGWKEVWGVGRFGPGEVRTRGGYLLLIFFLF